MRFADGSAGSCYPFRDWAAKMLAEPDSDVADAEADALALDGEPLVVGLLVLHAASRAAAIKPTRRPHNTRAE